MTWVNYQTVYDYYLYVSHFQKQVNCAFAYDDIPEMSIRSLYYIIE